jgi:hypothetical protein
VIGSSKARDHDISETLPEATAADQVVSSALPFFRRYAMKPRPQKPRIITAGTKRPRHHGEEVTGLGVRRHGNNGATQAWHARRLCS